MIAHRLIQRAAVERKDACSKRKKRFEETDYTVEELTAMLNENSKVIIAPANKKQKVEDCDYRELLVNNDDLQSVASGTTQRTTADIGGLDDPGRSTINVAHATRLQ